MSVLSLGRGLSPTPFPKYALAAANGAGDPLEIIVHVCEYKKE